MLKTPSLTTVYNQVSVLQYSKVLNSRNEWKEKATARADENRKHRKAKKRALKTIAKLKAKIALLEQTEQGQKNTPIPLLYL